MARNIHLTYINGDNESVEVHFTNAVSAVMWAAEWNITFYTIERAGDE